MGIVFSTNKTLIPIGYTFTFTKYESGKLFLTEHHLIFVKGNNKNPYKKLQIIIPLVSVAMDKWRIEEEGRRQIISGAGVSMNNVGVVGGTIHNSGKAHHIVVPYLDENGISQEPRFGVSSFGGKAIRELASKLYEQIVKETNTKSNQVPPSNMNLKSVTGSVPITDDPISVLKLRFAKGEISKEEYEDMQKTLSDSDTL